MPADFRSTFTDGEAYERYVGRWSRLVGRRFLGWLNVPAGARWLDVGAGTGILTRVILEQGAPASVVGIDSSADYLALARQNITDPRAEFRQTDLAELSPELPFDVAVAGLVLNFLPDSALGVQRMAEAVRPGGLVAAYVWDYGGRMEMMRQFWVAAATLDAAVAAAESAQHVSLCRPDVLGPLFESAGLAAVEVTAIDMEARFADFDDYWLPFLKAQGSAAKYLRRLDDGKRDALRDQLRRQLPTATDGSITLNAGAWAVKGQVQG